MQAIINPGSIQGTVKAPPSKSMMQRVCAAAVLHRGKTVIHNPGISHDDKVALHIAQQLGANILSQTTDTLVLSSNGLHPVHHSIDCGESGLSARLFTPIAALSSQPIHITGKGSLLHRPMDVFAGIFDQTGTRLIDFNGHIPFTIQGPLQPTNVTIDGSVSSQFLSGLLFAFAYSAQQPVTITVTELKSRPYIDLTLQVLAMFGKHIAHDDYERFHIDPSLFEHKEEVNVTIEGDWSSAACWIIAGAIAGDVTIEGLNPNSTQADKKLLDILQAMGAQMQYEDQQLRVVTSELYSFDFDATDSPDLFPMLSVLAATCKGESCITGIHRLWHKESNRIESITEMLHQFGVFYAIEDDTLCIQGKNKLQYNPVDSYNDHRIVMATAIGALRARGPVTIVHANAVNKSYPNFFDDLASLGVSCILKNE